MAVRIAGALIPNDKRVEIALTYVFGVGKTVSNSILSRCEIDKNTKVADLKEDEVAKIRNIVEKEMRVEGDLKRDVAANIKRLREIGTYRGTRHAKNLPVRGQRTKTNSRSVRGNKRMTAGSGTKPAAQKT